MAEDKTEKEEQEEAQKVNKDTPAVQGTFSTTRQVGDFRITTKIASPGSN